MPATADGILIANYTPSIPDEEFAFLRVDARHLAKRRPESKYAEWLNALVDAEEARRDAEFSAEPIEVALPRFNGSRWTGEQLADALTLSNVLIQMHDEHPGVRELLIQIHKVITAWVAARLQRIG